MKQGIYTITDHTSLTEGVRRLTLAGDTSSITRPGQFVNLLVEGCYLRRPISVADWDAETLTLIYKIVGRGTQRLARMGVGERTDLLVGLGNGFDTAFAASETLLAGGGAGVPPLIGLARRLCRNGGTAKTNETPDTAAGAETGGPYAKDNLSTVPQSGAPHLQAATPGPRRITAVIGFNTAHEVFGVEELEAAGAHVVVVTTDGSRGLRGLVTDALPDSGVGSGYFYACGPLPMLRALCERLPIPGQVSLEERMGCGFGACMGCTCRTAGGAKRICREGPVFKKEEILWNEILR